MSIVDACVEVWFWCSMDDITNWSTRCQGVKFADFGRVVVDEVGAVVDVITSHLTFGERFDVFEIF